MQLHISQTVIMLWFVCLCLFVLLYYFLPVLCSSERLHSLQGLSLDLSWASLPVLAGDSTVVEKCIECINIVIPPGRPLCECLKNSCPLNHCPSWLPQQRGHDQVRGQGLLQEDPFLQHFHHWVGFKCPLPWRQSQLSIPKVQIGLFSCSRLMWSEILKVQEDFQPRRNKRSVHRCNGGPRYKLGRSNPGALLHIEHGSISN